MIGATKSSRNDTLFRRFAPYAPLRMTRIAYPLPLAGDTGGGGLRIVGFFAPLRMTTKQRDRMTM